MVLKEQGATKEARRATGVVHWQPILKEYAMSVEKDLKPQNNSVSAQIKKRRFLSPE